MSLSEIAKTEQRQRSGEPVVLVSSDTHVGPRLQEDLRPYCPSGHRAAFDEFVEQEKAYRTAMREWTPHYFTEVEPGKWTRAGHNIKTDGHFDVNARLRDMDYDGVAAEVVFHGSANDEPIPFTTLGDPRSPLFFKNQPPENPELAAVGRHIYNVWLADFCSVEPERHVGLAQIPVWDVAASVHEMKWARSVGLKAINFPAPQPWLPQYNNPVWEPLWAAAEELEMPLITHFGAGGADVDYTGVDGLSIQHFETTVIHGRRFLPWLIYSGVFARHPGLKVGITEIPGYWWSQLLEDMDSIWRIRHPVFAEEGRAVPPLHKICPQLPSEYCRDNVFVGASFMSRMEAEAASREGYFGNMLWGSDYPHAEGTFLYPEHWEDTPMTHIALSYVYDGLPEEHVKAMLGANATRILGLDRAKLEEVARRINAPTLESINTAVEVPEFSLSLAFRQRGMFD